MFSSTQCHHVFSAPLCSMICATPLHIHGLKMSNKQLTPCLQACSFRALTQVLCQCSLKDLKENKEVKRPFTPASDAGAPSRPERSFIRMPHTPPVCLLWGWGKSCCQTVSLLSCLAFFLALHSRSTVCEYWNSHPSTMSKEARKRPTRPSQPNSWSSITASWSLSYHQVQMEIPLSQSRSALFSLWETAIRQSSWFQRYWGISQNTQRTDLFNLNLLFLFWVMLQHRFCRNTEHCVIL